MESRRKSRLRRCRQHLRFTGRTRYGNGAKRRKVHRVPAGMEKTMDNVDADLLAAVYNPSHPPFVNAYIHGKKT